MLSLRKRARPLNAMADSLLKCRRTVHVPNVWKPLAGLQAPQHTVIFDRDSLIKFVEQAGFEVVEYLPYGAFPAYFYLFAGAAFKLLKGQGLNLQGNLSLLCQAVAAFTVLLSKTLKPRDADVVCRRSSNDHPYAI